MTPDAKKCLIFLVTVELDSDIESYENISEISNEIKENIISTVVDMIEARDLNNVLVKEIEVLNEYEDYDGETIYDILEEDDDIGFEEFENDDNNEEETFKVNFPEETL